MSLFVHVAGGGVFLLELDSGKSGRGGVVGGDDRWTGCEAGSESGDALEQLPIDRCTCVHSSHMLKKEANKLALQ